MHGRGIAFRAFIPDIVTRYNTQCAEKNAHTVQGVLVIQVLSAFYIFDEDCMTSEERSAARYKRRKAAREAKQNNRRSLFDSFDRIADIDNLWAAFKKCTQGVAWKESVQQYEAHAMRNIIDARRKLLAGESVQNGFVEFDLHERGKVRHIKSIHISERVVQKALCDNVLVPLVSPTLIYDNGASVKGKGVHFALRRIIAHLSKFYKHNGSNQSYCLRVDFTKYFDSIDHAVLFEMQDRLIKDERVKSLLRSFISVFGDGKSLGLGSQISQICAIFFPNILDHWIKEKLRIKYYGRYMDDLYLIHESKEYLKHCLNQIEAACDFLKITINEKKTHIAKLSDGFEFLKGKYSVLPSGKILHRPCKDSTKRMRRKLYKFRKLIDEGKMDYLDLRTAYQSWRGNYRRRFHAYHRLRNMDKLYNELFITCHGDKREDVKKSGVAGKK